GGEKRGIQKAIREFLAIRLSLKSLPSREGKYYVLSLEKINKNKPMNNRKNRTIAGIYRKLLACFGPQHWWPGNCSPWLCWSNKAQRDIKPLLRRARGFCLAASVCYRFIPGE
ncbi:MAG: hypothetical protein WC476_12965, partial [Phycisphaerae bacterium]